MTLAELALEAAACTRCPLSGGRTQVVFGNGDPNADLMFVGEAPGRDEDLKGVPFVGRAGQLLDRLLREELAITRDDCFTANVLKCRPPGNRDPLPAEIDECRPWLERQIELIDPKVIVTLGNFATRLLLETTAGITKLRGRTYDYRSSPEAPVRKLVPTFHPSAALRAGGGDTLAAMRADLVRSSLVLRGAAA